MDKESLKEDKERLEKAIARKRENYSNLALVIKKEEADLVEVQRKLEEVASEEEVNVSDYELFRWLAWNEDLDLLEIRFHIRDWIRRNTSAEDVILTIHLTK